MQRANPSVVAAAVHGAQKLGRVLVLFFGVMERILCVAVLAVWTPAGTQLWWWSEWCALTIAARCRPSRLVHTGVPSPLPAAQHGLRGAPHSPAHRAFLPRQQAVRSDKSPFRYYHGHPEGSLRWAGLLVIGSSCGLVIA